MSIKVNLETGFNPKVLKENFNGDLTDAKDLFEVIENDPKKESIWYTKRRKVSFPVKVLHYEDISVYESVQLNFYEKFIILLLQKGIKSSNTDELIGKLSKLLNIALVCVEEFIEFLIKNSYLNFNESSNNYQLDPTIKFTINESLDYAMFADLSVKKADCNKILLVPELSGIYYLESDFSSKVFIRKGNENSQKKVKLSPSFVLNVEKSNDLIRELIVKYFSTTNYHLTKDFTFKLNEDLYSDYMLEFEATLLYEYNKESKISILSKIIVENDNILPISFIEKLLVGQKIDTVKPKFIEIGEVFYSSITVANKELSNYERITESESKELAPLLASLEVTQIKSSNIKKDHKNKVNNLNKEINDSKTYINEINEKIKVNESLLEEYEQIDNDLALNVKKTIRALMLDKISLEKAIVDLKTNQDKVDSDFSKELAESESLVAIEKEKVSIKESKIEEARKNELKSSHFVEEIIEKNNKKLYKIIQEVLDKYPPSKNIFNRYVSEICLELDKAISASEVNAMDQVAFSLVGIRDYYDKVIKVIFDLLLNKNEKNLGSYLGDWSNREQLRSTFNKRAVKTSFLQNLIKFNDVINAISHKEDNGKERDRNNKNITEFKKMVHKEREIVMLNIPDFFNSISLTKAESNLIISKLKM